MQQPASIESNCVDSGKALSSCRSEVALSRSETAGCGLTGQLKNAGRAT